MNDLGLGALLQASGTGHTVVKLAPKVGVFHVSFLPQFVPAGASVAGHTFFLAGIHVALSWAWFGGLIAATAPLHDWLHRPAAVRTLDRLAGGIFVAFGFKLAAPSWR